jgi:hypothetical protein
MGSHYGFRLPDHMAAHVNTKTQTMFGGDKTEYFKHLVRKDMAEPNPVLERQTAEFWLLQAKEQREGLIDHLKQVDAIIVELEAKVNPKPIKPNNKT